MRLWNELKIELIAELIAFILGIAVAWGYSRVAKMLPAKMLWRLYDPKRAVICVATSARIHTGKYLRPSTGIGQVRALAIIASSLDAAYKKVNTKNIILSDEPLRTKLENDLILLGGPKNNAVTKDFLERFKKNCEISQDETGICLKLERTPLNYIPVSVSDQIVRDYGLIVRTRNIFSNGKTVCLFSGGHTYGVVAAAIHFTQNYRGFFKLYKIIKPTLVAIVSCEVKDDCPVNIRLEQEYTSWT